MKQHVITEEAMQGLDGAIEDKWKPIVENKINNAKCPLCVLYEEDDCMYCPISEDTLQIYCHGTPFKEWTGNEAQEHAEAELAYLIDLKSRCTVEKGVNDG